MARWYDGYLIGPDPEPIHVYNPNSVARAIGSGHFSNYWTSTETYEALRVYIDMDFDGVQQDLVAMLDGQHVAADVSTFDNTMTGVGSRDEIYALLVHLGYLGYDEDDESVFIPNEEIRREFRTAIRSGARPELARLVRDSRELQRRTLEGDAALAQIRERDYPAALAGLSDECVLAGITYREGTDEHECEIERVAL